MTSHIIFMPVTVSNKTKQNKTKQNKTKQNKKLTTTKKKRSSISTVGTTPRNMNGITSTYQHGILFVVCDRMTLLMPSKILIDENMVYLVNKNDVNIRVTVVHHK